MKAYHTMLNQIKGVNIGDILNCTDCKALWRCYGAVLNCLSHSINLCSSVMLKDGFRFFPNLSQFLEIQWYLNHIRFELLQRSILNEYQHTHMHVHCIKVSAIIPHVHIGHKVFPSLCNCPQSTALVLCKNACWRPAKADIIRFQQSSWLNGVGF